LWIRRRRATSCSVRAVDFGGGICSPAGGATVEGSLALPFGGGGSGGGGF
jgi:hypothetical protein